MSIEYKLIKTYPNSPELNTVVTESSILAGVHEVTSFPEFWKKIVKKEYEILSLITHSFIAITTSKIDIEAFEAGHVSTAKFTIHSVRRLSDNEVFTVGDKVKVDFKSTIKGFKIDKTYIQPGISVFTNGYIVDDFNNCCLSYIQKDTPIFTTHDGVDIYETDNFVIINKNSLELVDDGKLKSISYIQKRYRIWDGSDGYLQFSTKEVAIDYIIMNKPCLSIKDITESTNFKFQTVIEELKKKVKAKIK